MARNPAFNTTTTAARAAVGGSALPAPYDALTAPTNDDLISASLALWPQGAAWGSPDGEAVSLSALLAGFTRVLIDPFVWLYGRAFALAREATVQGITELMPEWEAEYGLPEPCFSASQQTTAQRLTALSRKVMAAGINHPEEFVRVALDHGFEIEIEEPAIFECGFSEAGGDQTVGAAIEEIYLLVRVRDSAVTYFEAGVGEAGYDPLFSFGAAEQLLCLFRQLAPAWSIPVLAPWIEYAVLTDGAGNDLSDEYGNLLVVPLSS